MQYLPVHDRDSVLIHPTHTPWADGALFEWETEMRHHALTQQFIVDPEGQLLKIEYLKFRDLLAAYRDTCACCQAKQGEQRDEMWVGEPVTDIVHMDLRSTRGNHLYVARFEDGRLKRMTNWWERGAEDR